MVSTLSSADYSKVLRCARGDGDGLRDGVVEVLERAVSAEVRTVTTLSGPLFSTLKSSPQFSLLSASTRKSLEDWARESLVHTMRQEAVFCTATAVLGDQGISVLPLKGTCFNSSLYSNRYPRRCVDVDFLVSPEDYKVALRILGEHFSFVPDPLVPAENVAKLFEATFQTREGPAIFLEVHKGLTHPTLFDIPSDELWGASEPNPTYGEKNIRRLAWEHHLIHLAVHGFRDLRVVSHSLFDTAELIAEASVDWHRLVSCSRRWNTDVVLYAWLRAARDVLGAEVPKGVLAELEPAMWRRVGMRQLYAYGYSRAFLPKTRWHRFCQLASLVVGTMGMSRLPEFMSYRRQLLKGTVALS